jgi:hypothetical protein
MRLSMVILSTLAMVVTLAYASRCTKVMEWASANYKGYNGECLGFCNAAWQHVGVQKPCLQAYSAKDAALKCSSDPGWHKWDENDKPPASAVVLFECCNCPSNPYGHACLSDGRDGCLSQGGVGNHSFSWYRQSFCNVNPHGWILPAAC